MSELVHITHEGGDLSEWTATVTDGGDLSASTDAGLVGTYGMSGYIDDTNSINAYYLFGDLGTVSAYRFRFYIDLTDLTMQSGDNYYAGGIINNSTVNTYHYVGRDATGKYIIWYFRNDTGSVTHNSGKLYLSDAPHYVEVHMVRATTTSSYNGGIYVYVDGGLEYSATNFDNYETASWGGNDRIQLGAINNIDAGTSGYFYYDDIIVRDDGTEIGPALTTVEDSVTGDAVVLRTEGDTLTADAVIKATLTDIYWLADAVIQRAYSGSVTANAVIKKLDVGASVTANAVIKRTVPGSITSDAAVLRTIADAISAFAVITQEETDTFTADAAILRTEGGSVTADAVLYVEQSSSITGDAVVLKTKQQSVTADARIEQPGTEVFQFTGDAVVLRTEQDSVTGDAVVKRVEGDTFTADAFLVVTVAGSVTGNAVIFKTTTKTITARAVVRRTEGDTFTADAYFVNTTIQTFTADAQIYKPVTKWVFGYAVIKVPDKQASITANAVVKRVEGDSLTGDAVIIHQSTDDITADAVIFKVTTKTIKADAKIAASGQKMILASAVIKKTASGTFTADAYLLTGATIQSSVTGDAVVKRVRSSSITGDAVILKTRAKTFYADAYIDSAIKIREGSIIARAWIVHSGEPDPPVRFKIEGVQPPNPRGSPKGRGYRLHYPRPTGEDGRRRAVGAVGMPWIEINFEFIDNEVFDWYNAWIPEGDQWANIDSVQCWDPYADGGAQWVIFEGPDIRIWRPVVQAHKSGYYAGVRIIITNLS